MFEKTYLKMERAGGTGAFAFPQAMATESDWWLACLVPVWKVERPSSKRRGAQDFSGQPK